MPPIVALAVCSTLVITLLLIDSRYPEGRNISSWIPTLWLLYCASRSIELWFGGFQFTDELSMSMAEGSAKDRAFLTVLIIIALMILFRRKTVWRRVLSDNRVVFFLYIYMLISIIWSDYPFVSFKRWIKASGGVTMALLVLTSTHPLKTIEAILRRTAYILIPFSVLLIKYYPHWGVAWGRYSGLVEWRGVTTSKNMLGILCLVSLLFTVWTIIRDRKEFIDIKKTIAQLLIIVLSIWLMKGPGFGYSATSLLSLVIGLLVLFTLRRVKSISYITSLSIFAAILIVVLFILLSVNPLFLITNLTGREMNLSGRTDMIWPHLMTIAMGNPILGMGYGGYWIEPIYFDKLSINQAHNGYIDVFIELGIVGVFLLVTLIGSFYRKARSLYFMDKEWGSFLLAIMLIVIIHNFTESSFIKTTSYLWNIFILLMVGYSMHSVTIRVHLTRRSQG